ncbi:related to cyclosome/APC subunit Cut20/Apc4 [Cephalotrichum gorgonifer]|uniref:Anaphase-promoting complex subunit 4 n=1 Tax=Cephalotrichum gorgonifer TaxID=2041049 RepID=A0AAE8MVX6_9PEZI|nr:related to cyclosome/APC subunit Cut20/Apc4 [Cephalotrichum gorgonifer]
MVTVALTPFSETKYAQPAPPGLPASSPTVDLSVTWDADSGNVLVCRPRDEVVSRIHQGGRGHAPGVTAVRWKPDGQFIAVAWDDGYVRLMGLENNKAAHSIRVLEGGGDGSAATISHVAWTSNSVARKSNSGQDNAGSTWKSVLEKEPSLPDLPRDLMFLEVDTALPRISPLPSGSAGTGEDATVFTLRTGIDFLFQPFRPEDSEEVAVMVAGTDDSDVHLSIYDSFAIGSFKYQVPGEAGGARLRLAQHASHRDVSTHSLVFRPTDPERGNVLDIVPMDLSFIVSSPINLSLLASKLTTLQKLLRYLRQCFLHMQVEFKNSRELPSRFLSNIQEDLEGSESGPRDIVSALYHTLVTGHTHETVKEWLVDSLAERGHKRWDKAVTTSLTALRNLTHQNLLPALDRTSLILSRLRGLAEFHHTRDDTGLSPAQLARLSDTVSALTLAANHVLLTVTEELELFSSFSVWLRLQIDRLATGSAEELAEKEAGLDTGRVLGYIRGYLVSSPLAAFLGDGDGAAAASGGWDAVGKGGTLLETVGAQLKRRAGGLPYAEFLTKIGWLVGELQEKAGVVFGDVARAQERSVRFGEGTRVVLGEDIEKIDTCMGAIHREDAVDGLVYTALTAKNRENDVFLYRTAIPIMNGISSAPETQACVLSFPGTQIVDVKFLTPSLLLALVYKNSTPSILSIPLSPSTALPWTPHTGPEPSPTQLDTPPASILPVPTEAGDAFFPVQMDVHDASDARGPLPARVCLLGKDRCIYRVFKLEVKE